MEKEIEQKEDGRYIIFYTFDDEEKIEPAPLGPDAARMGSLRHPPSGSYVSASGGVLPLCPTKPGGFPTEVPREHYDIVVFENRFPSFAPNASDPDEGAAT